MYKKGRPKYIGPLKILELFFEQFDHFSLSVAADQR
jgi:hypothetical protein